MTTSAHEQDRAVATIPPRPPRDPHRVVAADQRPPRAVLYARRYVELDAYRRDLARGVYSKLRREDKLRLYGSTIVPIHVPLARGETKEQYEARFRAWLTRQGLTLEELERDPDENLERYYRFNFATENVNGAVKFDPESVEKEGEKKAHYERDAASRRKRSRSEDREPPMRGGRGEINISRIDDRENRDTKAVTHNRSSVVVVKKPRTADRTTSEDTAARRSSSSHSTEAASVAKRKETTESLAIKCVLRAPGRNASLKEVASAYSSCGCWQCLTRSMQHLAMTVTKLEARPCHTCVNNHKKKIAQLNTVDLTAGSVREALVPRRGVSPPSSQPSLNVDPVETHLVAAYNEINEQIVMNESALQTEIERLAANPLADIHEMTRLHDENREMQEMLQCEMAVRNAALAALVVYMWRHDPSDLESMMNDPVSQHVVPVQRLCHSRCAQIATAMAEKQKDIAKLDGHLKAIPITDDEGTRRIRNGKQRLLEALARAERKVEQLLNQRRQQLRVLVHFDADLRQLIRLLLAKAGEERSTRCA